MVVLYWPLFPLLLMKGVIPCDHGVSAYFEMCDGEYAGSGLSID